jgi:hypothetical protein
VTITTTEHAGWSRHSGEVPSGDFAVDVRRTGATQGRPIDEAVQEHMHRIAAGERVEPDPDARMKMAAVLHRLTGWTVFAEAAASADERAYVSRLWAEDWDCDEDAAYDDL